MQEEACCGCFKGSASFLKIKKDKTKGDEKAGSYVDNTLIDTYNG